jgi:hypothetical protein
MGGLPRTAIDFFCRLVYIAGMDANAKRSMAK